MMFEKFMIIGEHYAGWLEVWEGDFEHPYILIIKTAGGCGFDGRAFKTPEEVEMWLDFLDEEEDYLV